MVPGERRLLGITGAPAAGKSTVASVLAAALHPDAVLVPMDGFHLAQRELERLGRAERKGAPDTFDSSGFVALMRRLAAAAESVVYAPEFRREIEEPIAGAIPVPREYDWSSSRATTCSSMNCPGGSSRCSLPRRGISTPDESTRISRLVARHMAFGRDEAQAIGRALGSDQRNAELILATRTKATVIV